MIDLFDFVLLSCFAILLPLITDFLNNSFPQAKIGRIASDIVGIALVFFIATLIFTGVSLWYTHFLPFYYTQSILTSFSTLNIFDLLKNEQVNQVTFYIHIIFTCVLVINLYYYYYQSIVADNYQPKISATKKIRLQKQVDDHEDQSFCQQCELYSQGSYTSIQLTGDKTLHCRICKRCVNCMDHHCPFIANCVGKNNHHYFILFIASTTIAMIYATYLSFFPYYYCISNPTSSSSPLIQSCKDMNKNNYIFLCCCLIIMAAFGILLFQMYLVTTNSKTIQLLRRLKHSKTFTEWFKWLFQHFKDSASPNNITTMFPNFKYYNLIIPYNK